MRISEHASTDAYTAVLAQAGAFPRDWHTLRHIQDVRNRTGVMDCIDGTDDLRTHDLMQGLSPTAPPVDSDNDGIPDAWETAHGLDPNRADSTTLRPSGYLAIEEYINERAEALVSAR
jgi:pectate lyase